jgi:hypothetical protein
LGVRRFEPQYSVVEQMGSGSAKPWPKNQSLLDRDPDIDARLDRWPDFRHHGACARNIVFLARAAIPAMMIDQWNRCDVCGKFIAFAEFNRGAKRTLIYPCSDLTRETWETLCIKHGDHDPPARHPKKPPAFCPTDFST